ncbi:hypothetical protein [Maricaulis salignorans]|uniref:Holin-X, holin superfamily III n=1 Tax=Maricaulis salignorans TaxID=144026 RepID=A0A1G9T6Z5_9PROT|nr:hypothetical protein [Maricaulis salignorans]SDM43380.1 hypothetical protein SAMN04488568_11152 [Maricaulis salignorans]
MTTDPLKAFFEAGEAPVVDQAFRAATMQRIAQRRLHLGLARAALAGLVVFVALLLLRPILVILVLNLPASFGQAVLMLAATGLLALAGYYLATRTVPLPAWVQRLL